jgi:dinuclear metal center YbgI/SA1388 family protein
MLWQLIRQNIAVYSAHTAYDSSARGVNQQLAEMFGLEAIQPLIPAPADPAVGTGRCGLLPSTVTLHEFAGQVKRLLKAPQLHYAGRGDQPVQKVAVACGAAGQFAAAAARQGCDVFVTGEARFHGSLEAETLGIGLIVAGHYQTERPAVEQLATQLAAIFPGLSTSASSADLDPLHWV